MPCYLVRQFHVAHFHVRHFQRKEKSVPLFTFLNTALGSSITAFVYWEIYDLTFNLLTRSLSLTMYCSSGCSRTTAFVAAIAFYAVKLVDYCWDVHTSTTVSALAVTAVRRPRGVL